MKHSYPIYLAGGFGQRATVLEVRNPYSGLAWAQTFLASEQDVETAIRAGLTVQDELRAIPTYVRANALMKIAGGLQARAGEFAQAIALETAKPMIYARAEVERSIQTFVDGAEECKRIYGTWMALDRHPSGAGHEAIVRRFPVGLVAAVSPFNFPLNLVAHKLAPAIAAGCPIILKPASKTPISALLLAELIDATALPKGSVSILPMDRKTGDMLVTDERFKLLTFTGSPQVGWDMKKRAGKKKVVLELGGNAGLIITGSADLEAAAAKSVSGGFSFSGQSCIHTQRIFAHTSVFQKFKQLFVEKTRALVYGDPLETNVTISAMIDEANAERTHDWVKKAVDGGAELLLGGVRMGQSGYMPTILTGTTPHMLVCAKEAFAPVVILEEYTDFKDACAQINNSTFGLQAGVFTNNFREITQAYDTLEVGGVIINNVPTFRADHMPYGGVKDSGLGREGVRYAIEDMTELKTLVLNTVL